MNQVPLYERVGWIGIVSSAIALGGNAVTPPSLLRPRNWVPMMYAKRHLPDIEQWSQSSGSTVMA